MLPAIQPIVKNLTIFIREATWVAPPFGIIQKVYSEEEKKAFAEVPEVLQELRKQNETGLNSMFGLYLQSHEIQNTMKDTFKEQMSTKLKGLEW